MICEDEIKAIYNRGHSPRARRHQRAKFLQLILSSSSSTTTTINVNVIINVVLILWNFRSVVEISISKHHEFSTSANRFLGP